MSYPRMSAQWDHNVAYYKFERKMPPGPLIYEAPRFVEAVADTCVMMVAWLCALVLAFFVPL